MYIFPIPTQLGLEETDQFTNTSTKSKNIKETKAWHVFMYVFCKACHVCRNRRKL